MNGHVIGQMLYFCPSLHFLFKGCLTCRCPVGHQNFRCLNSAGAMRLIALTSPPEQLLSPTKKHLAASFPMPTDDEGYDFRLPTMMMTSSLHFRFALTSAVADRDADVGVDTSVEAEARIVSSQWSS